MSLRTVQRAVEPLRRELHTEALPTVHRVVSLAKRWILDTHQGAIDHAYRRNCLDEFVFRFKRRRSRSR